MILAKIWVTRFYHPNNSGFDGMVKPRISKFPPIFWNSTITFLIQNIMCVGYAIELRRWCLIIIPFIWSDWNAPEISWKAENWDTRFSHKTQANSENWDTRFLKRRFFAFFEKICNSLDYQEMNYTVYFTFIKKSHVFKILRYKVLTPQRRYLDDILFFSLRLYLNQIYKI